MPASNEESVIATSPKSQAASALREALCRDAIGEYAAMLSAISLALVERCWRGSGLEIEVALRQARAVLLAAIATYKDLAALGGAQ
ncbi:MAG: hypothetical protein HYS06_02070 [Methylocystis sp.]|nr:hypothetical protein [Methylocystis sp.]